VTRNRRPDGGGTRPWPPITAARTTGAWAWGPRRPADVVAAAVEAVVAVAAVAGGTRCTTTPRPPACRWWSRATVGLAPAI